MSLKFLYYVSDTKVKLLTGQLRPRTRLSRVRARGSAFGLGAELELGREETHDSDAALAREVTDLVKRMLKSGDVVSLPPGEPLSTNRFYFDSADWRHGLYSIRMSGSSEETATYIVWKGEENRLFLLLGSPANVLGERRVTEGTEYILASSRIVGNVMESSLQWELIQTLETCADDDPDEPVALDVDHPEGSHVDVRVQQRMPPKLIKAERDVLRGSALAAFCDTALDVLPTSSLETVFKIYHELPVSRAIAPYDVVYVGSPVFTALE